MKCISCDTEINPKWKHAIDQNICPFCGQSIMEELLKTLLTTLQDTMQKMQEYPHQLDDWMFSNYNYIKTDSPNLINFVPKEALKDLKKETENEEFERKKKVIKIKTDRGEEEVVTEKIQSDSKTAGFFERAEIIKRGSGSEAGGRDLDTGDESDFDDGIELKPIKQAQPKTFKSASERTEYLKKLKQKIETEGSQAVVSEKGLATMIDPNALDSADPEEVAAFQAVLSDGDIIASSLPNNLGDDDAVTERVLAANLAASKGKNKGHGGDYNEQDIRSLQRMQARVADARKAFENGENRGKNGFSRS